MADDLNDELRNIAGTKVDEPLLVTPIEGYRLTVYKSVPGTYKSVLDIELRLSRVGGAQLKGMADLITLIEDAVFKQEKKEADEIVHAAFHKED